MKYFLRARNISKSLKIVKNLVRLIIVSEQTTISEKNHVRIFGN